MSGYWEKEEFIRCISDAATGLYETENAQFCRKHKKGFVTDKTTIPNRSDISYARRMGCYFTPADRIAIVESAIDLENDGLLDFGAFTDIIDPFARIDVDNVLFGAYVDMNWVRRIKHLPPGYKPIYGYAYYTLISWIPRLDEKPNLLKRYICLDRSGRFAIVEKDLKIRYDDKGAFTARFAATYTYWADRKYLWNVETNDETAKVTFGVYPEQIKSLFYSRDLPLTETGRKRPILHWVSAHQRRIKEGIDIDIEKHLRGCTEFIFNGTSFKITRPAK